MTKIIPLWRDDVFNEIFNNEDNMDLIEHLIALLFNLDIRDIQGKAKLLARNLNKKKIEDAKKQVDILVDINGEKYNIEIEHSYSTSKLKKDYSYACNIHSRQAKKGIKDYQTIKATNLIVIFVKGLNQSEVLTRYPFRNKNEEEILEDSMRIYLLDVEKGMCYTEDTSKIVQFCHMLMAETEEELRKYTKGVFNNMEVEEKLINNDLAISMDPDDYSMTFDLSDEELDRNSRIREAREEGEAIGLEKGEVRKQNEIAKAMLKENMDKSLISKITKLSLSQIMML